ncbi:MAG TPA: hypothetical protein VF359_04025 [Anaerolineales bacterium]
MPKHWFDFMLLGVVWSASFLWIKIAVQEVGPLLIMLAGFRVAFGELTAILAIIFLRARWPLERATWATFAMPGITSVAIPCCQHRSCQMEIHQKIPQWTKGPQRGLDFLHGLYDEKYYD